MACQTDRHAFMPNFGSLSLERSRISARASAELETVADILCGRKCGGSVVDFMAEQSPRRLLFACVFGREKIMFQESSELRTQGKQYLSAHLVGFRGRVRHFF